MFKAGLAYEKEMPINWCPSCKTGLANEEVVNGSCERCGAPVTKKNLKQWMLKITAYAERLLSDLDKLDWPEKVKKMQTDWIGKSYGAEIDFQVDGRDEAIKVYTTRPDTLYGATFMVLAPEHAMAAGLAAKEQKQAVGVFAIAAILFLFLRSTPAEMGLRPVGAAEVPETVETQAQPAPDSFTLTPKMWAFMGCVSLFMGALANPGFAHLSVLYTSEGFDPVVVAAILSGTGVMITLGKLIYGETTDHLGGRRASLLFGGILLVGHVLCCLAFLQNLVVCGVTVLFLGIGYPIATIGPSVWANDMSSPDHYPTVVRRLQVIYAGGALLFASVPGLMADALGGYIPTYALMSGMLFLALCLVALAYREVGRRRAG